jgi:hypothetical protein
MTEKTPAKPERTGNDAALPASDALPSVLERLTITSDGTGCASVQMTEGQQAVTVAFSRPSQ